MTTVVVDGCSFTFPATTTVTKYDGWDFYRRFQSHGVKAVDLVVLDSESVLWLVEVKDYTHPDAEPVPFDELPSAAGSTRWAGARGRRKPHRTPASWPACARKTPGCARTWTGPGR